MILFSSNDRHTTHQKLEAVLADGTFPDAFCQEDFNAAEVYEVHHGLERLTPERQALAEALALSLK